MPHSPHTRPTPTSPRGPGVRLAAAMTVVAITLTITLTTDHAAVAADVRPAWECLPEETLLMVRVPDARQFAEAIGGRTRFGSLMMQRERLRKIGSILLDQVNRDAGEDVAERFSKRLGRHGLAPDDLVAAFTGDFGAAAIAQPANQRADDDAADRPVLLVIAWVEASGDELARRLFAGVASMADEAIEAAKGELPSTRTDVELAGRPTIWIRTPIVVRERRVGTAHLFASLAGRRLVFAGTMGVAGGRMQLNVKLGREGLEVEPQPPQQELPADEAERQSEAVGERAKSVLERFLLRQGEADGGSPLADLLEAPAMRAALPQGVPLVELVANPPVAANLLGKEAAVVSRGLAPFGLDGVGPIAWRQSLDGDVWRSNAFVTLPSPRRGLMRILDEDPDPAEVPAFMTREPIGFQQVSLDLGKAYSLLREAVLAGEEPPPGNAFGTAETTSLAMTGMELPDLLSALGTRHWFVSHPPRILEAVEHARRAKAAGGAAGDDPAPHPNPAAIVWKVVDEKPFAKLLELAGRSGGGKVVDEQGFRSIRLPMGLSVFLGQGHLVLAIGEGVAEKTLAAIRNPPADDAAFRTCDTAKRAAELVPPLPGRLYGVADNRSTGGTLGLIVNLVAATSPEDVEPENREFLAALREALPTPEEMRGILAAATTLWRADERGILMQSAIEMPAP